MDASAVSVYVCMCCTYIDRVKGSWRVSNFSRSAAAHYVPFPFICTHLAKGETPISAHSATLRTRISFVGARTQPVSFLWIWLRSTVYIRLRSERQKREQNKQINTCIHVCMYVHTYTYCTYLITKSMHAIERFSHPIMEVLKR